MAYNDLLKLVSLAESGGRDYDSQGRVITSPVGARGRMQVMDATNRSPGYGVAPAMNDSLDERARVGEQYLAAMVKNYGGDVRKGLAAYNAGPGNVDRALQRAQAAGDNDWMRYLPKPQETVPYVNGIVAKMGGKGGGTMDRMAAAVLPSANAAGASRNNRAVPADDLEGIQWEAAPTTLGNQQSNKAVPADDLEGIEWKKPDETSFVDGAKNFGRGLWQGATDMLAGAGQSGAHEGQQILGGVDELLGTNLSQRAQPQVQNFDNQTAQREADYQAATPDSTAAGVGRVIGTLATSAGPGAAIKGAAELGGRALAQAPNIGRLGGGAASGALVGAGTGATSPVTKPGNYSDQSLSNAGVGAMLGGAIPLAASGTMAAARGVANTAGRLVEPFSQAGQGRIANRVIARAADNGPVNVNAAPLVEGSTPTLAQSTANPGIAGLERGMRNDPNFSAQFVERDVANQAARNSALEGIAGDAADVALARSVRDSQANQAVASLFEQAQPANTAPVLQTIDTILQGSSGKRDAVRNSVSKVRGILQDADGNVESNPATLYDSARKQIGDMLDKTNLANPEGRQASRELLQVRDALDDAIESGAPGFKTYLADYTQQSQPINAMEFLQSLRLTDAQGNLTLSKVQNAMESIKRQRAAAGTRDAKALTDVQLKTLENVRDDLLRSANTGAGRAVGSNTAQNLAIDNVLADSLPGGLGQVLGRSAAGGALNRLGQVIYGGTDKPIRQEIVNRLLNPVQGSAALDAVQGPPANSAPQLLINRLTPYIAPTIGVGAAQSFPVR